MMRAPSPRWLLWYGVFLHSLWGALLVTSPLPLGATPLNFFHPLPAWVTGLGFLAVTGLAVAGLMRPVPGRTSLLLLLPQQGVLMVSGLSALSAVVGAAYADGVPRPRLFIGADQAPMILTVALHTLALIEMHSIRPAKAAPVLPPPTDPDGLPVTAGAHT